MGRLQALIFLAPLLCGGGARCAPAPADPDIPVFRIFNDAAGKSHVERTVWRAEPHAAFGQPDVLHAFFASPAKKLVVVGGAPGFHAAAHNTAGVRELVFLIQGSSSARFSDGTVQDFRAGDVILIEDREGEGTELSIGPDGYLGFAVILDP